METAKDIMSSPAVSINEEETLQKVIKMLAINVISGLPVVNDKEEVSGIISETDIIRYSQKIDVVPMTSLSGWISPYTDVSELTTLRSGRELLHQTKVKEVMTKKVFSVTGDTGTNEIASLMNRRKINRVPVVDSTGKLLGVITRTDIVKSMAKM